MEALLDVLEAQQGESVDESSLSTTLTELSSSLALSQHLGSGAVHRAGAILHAVLATHIADSHVSNLVVRCLNNLIEIGSAGVFGNREFATLVSSLLINIGMSRACVCVCVYVCVQRVCVCKIVLPSTLSTQYHTHTTHC
jgi:hypothetical protein